MKQTQQITQSNAQLTAADLLAQYATQPALLADDYHAALLFAASHLVKTHRADYVYQTQWASNACLFVHPTTHAHTIVRMSDSAIESD